MSQFDFLFPPSEYEAAQRQRTPPSNAVTSVCPVKMSCRTPAHIQTSPATMSIFFRRLLSATPRCQLQDASRSHNSHGLKRLPAPLMSTDMQPPLGGDSEPCVPLWDRSATRSPVSQLFHHHPIPVSFSGFSSTARSALFLSGPTEVVSTQQLFLHCLNNSVPSPQPDSFSRPDAPSGTTPFTPLCSGGLHLPSSVM